jgi:predicted porin
MKKLLAAAVAAAVIAPASVMAAGPTLYGKLHTVISHNDNNGSGAADYSEWSMSDRSSRVGVKGSEDLGNGMKVGYLIEWAIAMDGSGNDMGQRNRAITLSGDWGTALVGRWDVPYKSLGRKVELFGDSLGDLRNLNGDHDLRLDNVVAYVTPNMNGFSYCCIFF